MPSLRSFPCLLLLALPCAAMADPVTVTMSTSGRIDANPLVIDDFWPEAQAMDQMPFTLTMSAVFESGSETYGSGSSRAWDPLTDFDLSFELGGMTYHPTTQGGASATLYHDTSGIDVYQMEVYFGPSANISFSASINGPAGSFGSTPLAPVKLESAPGLSGSIHIGVSPSNPDAPGYWVMDGKADSFYLQVASAVPEPAPFGMLAAGVLTLGWWRWRVRRPISSTA
jgi:hypothetical protein